MTGRYNWKRRWVRLGAREAQETNISAISQFWLPEVQQTTNSVSLDELENVQVVILLGEPGIGKSSEIEAYVGRKQANKADGQKRTWERERYPPGDFKQLFDSAKYRTWREGHSELTLVLDSFDESDSPVRMGRNLVDALEDASGQLGDLSLRIACRTADWPEDTFVELRRLFGDENVVAVELDALGRQEVIEAAKAEEINVDQFLGLIEQNALAALTLKPITLRDLFSEYRDNGGVLPGTRNALYQNMCRRLCEEHNQFRDEADRRGNYTKEELIDAAGRLAFLMLTTRQLSVWMPSSTIGMPIGSIAVEELHSGSSQEDRLTRATLHTGLFSSRGPSQLGWAHLSYAQYLAASYMHRNLSFPQIKSLLVHPDGNKIIPQLREVASWLTTMDSEILEFVIDLDPEALFQSDLVIEDVAARERLTALYLSLYNRRTLIEIPFDNRPCYRRLRHPKLSEQLTRFAHDSSQDFISRFVAIDIIYACELSDAANGLVDLALDPNLEHQLRVHAAYIVARIGGSNARLALKPLVAGVREDVDDQLKGAALIATWPAHLTSEELFDVLTPRKKTNLIGNYSTFLRPDFIDDIPEGDLPVALRWAANFIQQFTNAHHHVDFEFQAIIDELVYEGWQHFDSPGVADALALVILVKVAQFHGLFGDTHGQRLDSRYQGAIDDLIKNEAKRRQLLIAVIDLITNLEFDFFALNYRIPLLLDSDLPWLLDLLDSGTGTIPKDKNLGLVKAVFRSWNSDHMDMMALAMESDEELREVYGKWFYTVLDSEHADRSRQAFQRERQFAAEELEITARRQKRLIDPPPLKRLEEVLDQCERGEIEEWWRTNSWMAANEFGSVSDWYGDIREMPNWEQLDEATRIRVFLLGNEYLNRASPEPEKWLGKPVLYHPALAAYRMLFLLFDSGFEIPTDLLAKWTAVVVTFPDFLLHANRARHNEFLAMVYRTNGAGFRDCLKEYMKHWQEAETNFVSVQNYLHRFGDFLDDDLIQVLLDYLNDPATKEQHYRDVLPFLVRKQVPDAFQRALSDFLSEYSKYKAAEQELQVPKPNADSDSSDNQNRSAVQRTALVDLGADLLAFPLGGEWWDSVWTIIQADEDFGRSMIEATAGNFYDRRTAKLGSQLPEKDTADLYLWIAEHYPFHEDPDLYSSGPEMQRDNRRHDVAEWRNNLLNQLAERGTSEALEQIGRIGEVYPDLYQLKRLQKNLNERLYKSMWRPPQLRDVLSLLMSGEQRLVQTDNQLLDLIIESLGRLQQRLQGETPSARDLWNEVVYRPKDEIALSDYVKRHLDQDLRERGIVVNREVEIRQRVGGDGAAPGEIPDLYVSAVNTSTDNDTMKRLVVLIEVKGNWHDELKTAIRTQLVGRYLRDNDKATCGLYLVGWFNCPQWDKDDGRRAKAMRNQYDALRKELEIEAVALSSDSLDVRVCVLDVSLRSDTPPV